MQKISIRNKQIEVYSSVAPDRPVIYLNTFAGEGGKVYEAVQKADCPDFTLVAINGLEWDCDMAPWSIPPISKNDTPCTGGADAYLQVLTEEILPHAESRIPGKVLWRGIAGYSLAGLFALWSVYQTALFDRAASVSGSLWFPDFKEYVMSHTMKGRTEHLYLSLGDKEAHTRNPYLKCVQKNTEEIAAYYKQQGFDTIFALNPGNHYTNAVGRTAAGILWLLSR